MPWHESAACPDLARNFGATVDELASRVEEAVAAQAVADVPVAALLSGGIDSSLVVAAHRRATGDITQTFNVRFPDAAHDETPVAHAVAAQWSTNHHTVDLGDAGVSADTVIGLLRHFDQPFADTSCIPMYRVSAAVRDRGIICALSGDGGDEAFGGYARFWRAMRLVRLMRLPRGLRRAALAFGRSLAATTRDFGRQLAKAAQLAEGGTTDSAILLDGLSSYLTEAQKAELVPADARRELWPSSRLFDGYAPPAVTDIEELSRRMTESLFRVSLPSDMLRKVDMMSMRAGIEVRVPLLDEEVVALGLTLPHAMKTDGRSGKLVLRALAERWLPPSVARHPKHGFSIPLDVMVPPELHTALRDLLLGPGARTASFASRALVRGWLDRFAAARDGMAGGAISRAGLYQRVMMLLSLELWLRDFGLSW